MFADRLETTDPVRPALAWIASRGIDVRPWPAPAPDPTPGAIGADGVWTAEHRAVLHVVAPDAAPPRCGPLEDWIRAPLDRDELYARADLLLARVQRHGPVHVGVDADGILRVDDHLVILSPTEALIMAELVRRIEQVVAREELVRLIWPHPGAEVRLLAKHIASLRRKIGRLPLEVHAVRSQGLLLERVAPV